MKGSALMFVEQPHRKNRSNKSSLTIMTRRVCVPVPLVRGLHIAVEAHLLPHSRNRDCFVNH